MHDGRFLPPTADELWKTIFLERQDVLSRGRVNVTLSISMSLSSTISHKCASPYICVLHTATSVINKIIIFSSLPSLRATKAPMNTGSSGCRQAICRYERVHGKGKEPPGNQHSGATDQIRHRGVQNVSEILHVFPSWINNSNKCKLDIEEHCIYVMVLRKKILLLKFNRNINITSGNLEIYIYHLRVFSFLKESY